MKIVMIVSVMVFGPLIGAAIGFLIACLRLPLDPTGTGAPGDGIIFIFWIGLGFVLFAFASVAIVAEMIWGKAKTKSST